MVKSTLYWELSVDRGPDCLFVKIRTPDKRARGAERLADKLWSILSKHFVYRLVLEMEEVDRLPSPVIDELVTLKTRIQEHGGMLRLCGLSDTCRQALNESRLPGDLPNYQDRADAVVGHHASYGG
jgi:anti-anti-sigma regulatory factor